MYVHRRAFVKQHLLFWRTLVLLGLLSLWASPSRAFAAEDRIQQSPPRRTSPDQGGLPPFPRERPATDFRALLEISAALGIATIWYILDDRNVFDWDHPSLEERLNGEAWRFDNNTFGINYLAHPLNGAGMYVLSRGNRVGVWPSLGYTILGSTFWEYVIEFQEKVSINDMIITPGVGLAFGEFFHKLSWYVSSSRPKTPARTALTWSLGLSVQAHRAWDGRDPPPAPGKDALGFSSAMWHDFAAGYALGITSPHLESATSLHRLQATGELVSIPDYLQPKALRGWFHRAEFSRASLGLEISERGVGYDLFAETIAVGYHFQTEQLASTTGLSAAYLLRDTKSGGYDDRQGLLLAPGLVTDFRARRTPFNSRLRLAAYPAFGSLSSLAYEQWQARNPGVRTKTILGRAGYSYSFGWTTLAELRLAWSPLQLRTKVLLGDHASIEGLDRSQEEVTLDAPLTESVAEYSVGAWLTPERFPLEIGLHYELRRRTSSMGTASERTERSVESERTLLWATSRF